MSKQSFYNSKAWKRCREGYMSKQLYICERCGSPAIICHHKEYITDSNMNDPEITLNWDNLECLCFDCHNKEHFQVEGTMKGLQFDENGQLKKV